MGRSERKPMKFRRYTDYKDSRVEWLGRQPRNAFLNIYQFYCRIPIIVEELNNGIQQRQSG